MAPEKIGEAKKRSYQRPDAGASLPGGALPPIGETIWYVATYHGHWVARRQGAYRLPSESIFRGVLIRVDPVHLDGALQRWNAVYGEADDSRAIDAKTMCNAIDRAGRPAHVMGVVGHQSNCYTQKKSGPYP